MDSVEQRVKQVVARQLKVDINKIQPHCEFAKDLGAESIQSVELVAAFEEEFDIDMDEDAALSVKSVGGAVKFISDVMKQQGKLS